MQVKIICQNSKENCALNSFLESFSLKPKKVFMFVGELKEAGFRLIEEEFIDTKIKLKLVLGVNKKHTTKNMLENILNYTKDVYYYSNNDVIEFDSNITIFEYANSATIYTTPAAFSESCISENISLYTKIDFDFNDKKDKDEYKKIVKNVTKSIEDLNFEKLTKEVIEKLAQDKEIFTTRQYTHTNVMSISELLGKNTQETKKEMTKDEIDDVYVEDKEIPKIDLSSIDMDIDIDDMDLAETENTSTTLQENIQNSIDETEIEDETIDTQDIQNIEDEYEDYSQEEIEDINDEGESLKIDKDNELYDESLEDMDFDEDSVLDINDMLFSKSDVTLDVDVKQKREELKKKEIEENNEKDEEEFQDIEDELVQVKKVNLNNVSNLIMQLPNSPKRLIDRNVLKVRNSIQKVIPNFFELQDKGSTVVIGSSTYKERNITIEVVNVKTGEKYTDRNVKLTQKKGQSYLTITSDVLKNIEYDEKDIVRIIKLSQDTYHLEIIAQDIQEYKLWNKLCNQTIKATTRKFGVM